MAFPRINNEIKLGDLLTMVVMAASVAVWFWAVYGKQQEQINAELVAQAALTGRVAALETMVGTVYRDHDILLTISTQLADLKREIKR